MPFRTLHAGEGCRRVLACERSHQGFSCQSRDGHAFRERLSQAGLRGSDRRGAACHSVVTASTSDCSLTAVLTTATSIADGSDHFYQLATTARPQHKEY